jgi:DNA-binding IclR family transcriptional regulator
LDERSPFEGLRRFLLDHVATYDELEVLLLVQRHPEVDWTAAAAAERVGLPTEASRAALESLVEHDLLVRHGNPTMYRYAPASNALAVSAEQVQLAHRRDRFAIVQVMTTNAMDRVRGAAIRRLGEALQLRDSKKNR